MTRLVPMTFTAALDQIGDKRCVYLPFDPDEVWGPKEVHHVSGTVHGHPWRGPVQALATGPAILFGPSMQKDRPLPDGEPLTVTLEPEGPLGDRLPADFRTALEADPAAEAYFEALPSFYRKNVLRDVEAAKRPETRAKRVADWIAKLREAPHPKSL